MLSGKAFRESWLVHWTISIQDLGVITEGQLKWSPLQQYFDSFLRVSKSKAFLRKVEQDVIFMPKNNTSYIFFANMNISTLQKVLSLSQTPSAHMIVGKMG